MSDIKLSSEQIFSSTADILKQKLDKSIEKNQNNSTYSNSEAALTWIIRGSIDYFNKIDSSFLGEGNATGIPSSEADHFANNIYRLVNAINYLARLWRLEVDKTDEIKLLLDIRTLIIHSGEQINKVESLKLEGYKDSQLGRILRCDEQRAFPVPKKFSNMDYIIDVWNDKHNKKHNIIEVDYHSKNKSYYDLSIYLKGSDVRNVVLRYIESFLKKSIDVKPETTPTLPNIKERVINKEHSSIDFDKLARLVSNNLRGGYFKERDIEYWDGYGLKRLYEYVQHRSDISDEVREIIFTKIENVISKYWDDYQNENIPDNELPALDIRTVFKDYTPTFKLKSYLEGEKLFRHIAPYFNTREWHDATDINYLELFIKATSEALEISFDLDKSVDQLICAYFVQSVQIQINSKIDDDDK